MAHDGPEHGSVEEAAERLISLAEAADVCGLSAGYLRQLVRNRVIWGKKIGRNWVTTEEAVTAILSLLVLCSTITCRHSLGLANPPVTVLSMLKSTTSPLFLVSEAR